MTEQLEGQDTLPADFPEPALTCDLIIKREITDAIMQHERYRAAFRESMNFPIGDKSDAALAARYKFTMHLQSYIASAAIADLLRTIQGMAPGLADGIARQFDWLHESGEAGDLIWDWAIERGLDPEAITEAAKAEIEEKDTK